MQKMQKMQFEAKEGSNETVIKICKHCSGGYELTVYVQEGFFDPSRVELTLGKKALEGLIRDLQKLLE